MYYQNVWNWSPGTAFTGAYSMLNDLYLHFGNTYNFWYKNLKVFDYVLSEEDLGYA